LLLVSLTLAVADTTQASSTSASYRNVTVYQDIPAGIVGAELFRWGIFANNQEAGIVADVIKFIIDNSYVYFSHFSGSAFQTLSFVDITAADLAFLTRFEEIVEYLDTNGTPGFQRDDTILSRYPLWNITNYHFNFHQSNGTFPGGVVGPVNNLTCTTPDGVFSFSAAFAGRPVTLWNVSLDENSFKLDFRIRYYNWTGASSNPDAQIALVVSCSTQDANTHSFRSPNATLPTTGFQIAKTGYNGFINFENECDTFDVNGTHHRSSINYEYSEGPYFGSFSDNWAGGFFVLSYNQTHPVTIYHDPEIGAELAVTPTSPPSSSASSLMVSGLVGFLALFALFV